MLPLSMAPKFEMYENGVLQLLGHAAYLEQTVVLLFLRTVKLKLFVVVCKKLKAILIFLLPMAQNI